METTNTIDLTEDLEEKKALAELDSKTGSVERLDLKWTGRKRTSEEFEHDLPTIPWNGQVQFTSIDDVIDDPPPPYSTTHPSSTMKRLKSSGSCAGISPGISRTKLSPIPSTPSKHPEKRYAEPAKPPIRDVEVVQRRGGSESPRKHGGVRPENGQASLSKTVQRPDIEHSDVNIETMRPQRISHISIADSEDEEEDMFVPTETVVGLDKAALPDMHDVVDSQSGRDVSVVPSQSGQILKNSPTSKVRRRDLQIIDHKTTSTPTNSRPPPAPILSPATICPPHSLPKLEDDIAEDAQIQVFSKSDSIIKDFALWSTKDLHIERTRALDRKHLASKALIAAEEDLEDDTTLLQMAVHKSKLHLNAIEDLLQGREKHIELSKRLRLLQAQLVEEVGSNTIEQSRTAHRSVVVLLGANESELVKLIHQAQINLTQRPTGKAAGAEQPKTCIRATQVAPHKTQYSTQLIPDSTPGPTQRVEQTQAETTVQPTRSKGFETFTGPAESTRLPSDSSVLLARKDLPFANDQPGPQLVFLRPSAPPVVSKVSRSEVLGSKVSNTSDRTHGVSAISNPAPTIEQHEIYHEFHDDVPMVNSYMGTPPARITENDDDDETFDIDEDDTDMLEFVNAEPSFRLDNATSQAPGQRSVLSESSNNLVSRPAESDRSNPFSKSTKLKTSILEQPGLQHPWTADVLTALRQRFRLRGFRPHQLEAINATLSGEDAFVLMPTGGGKSLCYQLPAIIQSGRTRGVTVVISPLLSLMEDQVAHLQKLNIQAKIFNGEVSTEEKRLVMNSLYERNVEQFIQLLYVTPEMLSKNEQMISAFKSLHQRGKFARIIIDEAHCVSQWGHDFRPDYKALGEIRANFDGVPMMALTATATENVKVDVVHNLNMEGCRQFSQSFNRPGLSYKVLPKGRGAETLDAIAQLVMQSYRGKSGIIYCLARKKCEDVAKLLNGQYHIRAHHYHAGMESREKKEVQKGWQSGKYQVIVATIAFGMGIDKADVRFVIHHTLPKSLEGYYQETGRAGRDGRVSGCYLFYSYHDCVSMRSMIDKNQDLKHEQKQRQYQMLQTVVQFCENKTDCRRVQVLAYFGEIFNKENCDGKCDNCTSNSTYEMKDFTEHAKVAINIVKTLEGQKLTAVQCSDIMRGAKTKRANEARANKVEGYGFGMDLDRGVLERLLSRLLHDEALKEEHVTNRKKFTMTYIKVRFQFFVLSGTGS